MVSKGAGVIAGLKPYANLKNSGVEWLGSIPGHWNVRRLKYLLRERDSRSRTGEEQLLRVSQYTGITERKRDDGADGPDTRAASLVGYKVVERRDLAVNIMLAWNGSLGVSPYDGIVSPAYGVYRFNSDAEPMYFHHLLRSPAYKKRIKSASRGVVESRLRLYTDDLYRIEGVLPPKDEQAAIVRFLDHADRRIRRAIAAKQKLIRLLEEQKQAVIHRAVTRGLDPDVRLKPSGVEWLGDVPEHWEVRKIASLAERVTKGTTPTTLGASFEDVGVRFFKVESISDHSTLLLEKCAYISSETNEALARSQLAIGDVLVAIAGAIGRVAIVAESDIPANCNQAVAIVRPWRGNLLPWWLAFVLSSPLCQRALVDRSVQSAQANLSLAELRSLLIPLPSVEEQETITQRLQFEITKCVQAKSNLGNEVNKIREFHKRLIADVVTGKLDVREAAARLPDSPESGLADEEALDIESDDALPDEAITEDAAA